ncbi:MAG: methylmalonyl Co-A mutase-associated GTPase MeaB [bacterium]|nr:methylmalonyl Co-A mutase-associated GTPase MeaB [bacterium]
MTVLEKFRQGDTRALSRIISFVENREEGYRKLLGRLYADIGGALRIGVTGPPGAGKSTLVSCLIRKFREEGKRVAVVAVDPTSPFSGGALLGDRVRLQDFPDDGNVFFRSMATRGASGGLAASTDNVALLLDAFGFDIVLIETVGVGQVELDVIDTCDTVLVVLVPESGDAVQAMKAGLMEIADVMVVNKSDRPGADNLADDLKYALHLQKRDENAWEVPIMRTQAANNIGIDELFEAVNGHSRFAKENGYFDAHRKEQIRKKLFNILRHRFQRELIETLSGREEVERLIAEILSGRNNPYQVGEDLYDRFVRKNGTDRD